jgi:hypothetical protein
MGLSRVFERLYTKVYVGIVVSKSKVSVLLLSCSGEVCKKNRAEFEVSEGTASMNDFIQRAIAETPFYYISVLNHSVNQGALPVCDKKLASEYVDISLSKTLCLNDYMLYSSKYDLDTVEKSYKEFGVDFIFSPFSLLERVFKDKLHTKAQMYLLIEEDRLSLTVYKNSVLKFGTYEVISSHTSNVAFGGKESEEEAISFDLDTDEDAISIDDLDALDDLADLDDLDAISELDDFSDESVNIDTIHHEDNTDKEDSFEDFGEDYNRFLMIQKCLQEYYEDERYENEFIETVYIADGTDGNEDLKRYLEEELFLNVIIRKINLNDELLALTQEEVRCAS